MARARSDNRDKAKLLWENSKGKKKTSDIAEELGVSETQIRKWKSIDKWGKVTKLIPKRKNATNGTKEEKKKRGAPKENKNSVGNKGGRAPVGNKNNLKTGEFESIFFENLTVDEIKLINAMNFDKAESLQKEIALLTVREYRILGRIKKAKESNLIGTDVNSTIHKNDNGDTTGNFTSKRAETSDSFILKLEQSLTNVQDKKIRAIESLAKIEQGYMKLQLERDIFEWEKGEQEEDNTGVNNFIEAIKIDDKDINNLFVQEVEYEEIK